jgi:uncharacterized OsmC-like protein
MYQALVENLGDTKYHAKTRHGSFIMDTSAEASNPVDALLASLCACVGHYVHDYQRDRGFPPAAFTVRAEASATPDGSRLAAIAVSIDLRDIVLRPSQVAELMAVIEKCKVLGTLRRGCPIEVTLQRQVASVA